VDYCAVFWLVKATVYCSMHAYIVCRHFDSSVLDRLQFSHEEISVCQKRRCSFIIIKARKVDNITPALRELHSFKWAEDSVYFRDDWRHLCTEGQTTPLGVWATLRSAGSLILYLLADISSRIGMGSSICRERFPFKQGACTSGRSI